MVVHGIYNNNIYFLYDLPDITILNISGTLNMTISVNGISFIEKYNPDIDGVVVVKALSKVFESYFELPLYEEYKDCYILNPVSVNFSFTDLSGSTDLSISVVFSKAGLDHLPGVHQLFYTRFKKKKTSVDMLEFLTFFKIENMSIVAGIAYFDSSKNARYKKVDISLVSDLNCMCTCDVSPYKIAKTSGISVDSIIFYNITLLVSDYEMDTVRYDIIDKKNYPSAVNFIYINPFGGFDSVSFLGSCDFIPELDGNISSFFGLSRRLDSRVKDVRKVYSGYIEQSTYNAVTDMLISEKVYTLNNGRLTEVVINDAELDHSKPTSEAWGISVSYYPSKRDGYMFDKEHVVVTGIFDKTFDHTFD